MAKPRSKPKLKFKSTLTYTPLVTMIFPRSSFTSPEIRSFTNLQLTTLGYIAVNIKLSDRLSAGQPPEFRYT